MKFAGKDPKTGAGTSLSVEAPSGAAVLKVKLGTRGIVNARMIPTL